MLIVAHHGFFQATWVAEIMLKQNLLELPLPQASLRWPEQGINTRESHEVNHSHLLCSSNIQVIHSLEPSTPALRSLNSLLKSGPIIEIINFSRIRSMKFVQFAQLFLISLPIYVSMHEPPPGTLSTTNCYPACSDSRQKYGILQYLCMYHCQDLFVFTDVRYLRCFVLISDYHIRKVCECSVCQVVLSIIHCSFAVYRILSISLFCSWVKNDAMTLTHFLNPTRYWVLFVVSAHFLVLIIIFQGLLFLKWI